MIKKMKKIYLLFLIIFLISSCKSLDRKIDNLTTEEEKKLTELLGQHEIVLIDNFGRPDDVIHDANSKVLIFTTKKYKITCVRKFTINNKGIISGFNSRNCF
tara:strand:+ start:193 stop:498 length:306 start_codon:yes stop_codon:yes gene_type:complete